MADFFRQLAVSLRSATNSEERLYLFSLLCHFLLYWSAEKFIAILNSCGLQEYVCRGYRMCGKVFFKEVHISGMLMTFRAFCSSTDLSALSFMWAGVRTTPCVCTSNYSINTCRADIRSRYGTSSPIKLGPTPHPANLLCFRGSSHIMTKKTSHKKNLLANK